MSDRPNIIWSNENLDYEDWRDSLAEDYPDLTEAEREALMYELSADHLDDGGAFSILEHVADRGLLHVQNLAADRQQRLELGIAGCVRSAERRVPLDDEQLAQVAVSASAVFQFRGQCR